MDKNHLAQNQMQQNPNYTPCQTNPLPINHHQTQGPGFNPPQHHYLYPPVGQQNAYPPPPGTELPPPVTVTVSYVTNPDPNLSWGAAYTPLAAPYSAGVTLPSAAIQVQPIDDVKKAPKRTKIVQSQWCEVCKIDCNSKDVLDNHKLGKKHKRNLEKLRGPPTIVPPATPAIVPASLAIVPAVPAIAPLPASTSVTPAAPAIAPAAPAVAPLPAPTSVNPIIGPLEKPDGAMSSNARKAKRKKAAASDDVETKRLKVLGGGAAAEAIRTCTYCNVVCNSETVYSYHIAGHKHATNVKKHALLVGSASAV